MDNSRLNEQGYGIYFDIYQTSMVVGFTNLLNKIMDDLGIINNKTKLYYNKRDFVRNLLANLIVSMISGQPIIMDRDETKWGLNRRYSGLYMSYTIMVEIIDKFIEKDLLTQHIGYFNREDDIGRITRIETTNKTLSLIEQYCTKDIDFLPKKEPSETIVLTKRVDTPNNKKKHKSVRILYTDTRNIKRMRARVVRYNEFMKQHSVWVRVDEIGLNVQQLRILLKLLISGQISNLSLTLTNSNLYNTNYNTTPIPTNLYNNTTTTTTTTTITNGILNYTLSMCLNYLHLHRVFNRRKFTLGGRFYGSVHQQIPRELRQFITIDDEPTVELDYGALHIRMLYHMKDMDYRDDPYSAIANTKEDRTKLKYIMLIAINDKSENSVPYSVQKKINEDREAGIDTPDISRYEVLEYIDRFKKYHKDIAEYICSDKGIELQFKDSTIMDNILNKCVKINVPCLSVHDSIIVKAKDKDFAMNLMMEEYKNEMKYYPVITVKGE